MRKLIIGTLAGGILIFIWSALSWMVLPTHQDTFKYNANQDALMQMLKEQQTADGAYMLPAVDDTKMKHGSSEYQKASKELMDAQTGKPWAILIYGNAMNAMGGGMFACGLLYDLLIALALCLAVSASSGASFMSRFIICLAIGVAFACKGPLSQHNWMGYPLHYIMGDVWDSIMEAAIAGAFISWWYGRK